MTEPFDAVLAEMRVAKFLVPASALREYHDRLSAAHAAEVGEVREAYQHRTRDYYAQGDAYDVMRQRADRAMGLLREWAICGSPQNATLSRETDAFLAEQAQVGGENGLRYQVARAVERWQLDILSPVEALMEIESFLTQGDGK